LDVRLSANVDVGRVSWVIISTEDKQLQVLHQQIRGEVFDSVRGHVDYYDVLQVHEDFVRKMLDLVVLEMQILQIRQIQEDVFGQILNLIVVQPQFLKIFKMLEVCAFDEFDLLVGHIKFLQVLESLTDSGENVIERSKLQMNGCHTEMSFGVFVHSIGLQFVL
jgi:hypothetical protein